MSQFFHLFEVYGIELEYMLVNSKTFDVLPKSDELFKQAVGEYVSDVSDGKLEWSNELVKHVVEIKTAKPVQKLYDLDLEFHRGVQKINSYLSKMDAKLLPSAMHPFMNVFTQTKLWDHENDEVYNLYNRIFDCRGHGWSNVQSTHINFPYADEQEFVRLHAAIRCVLPLVPALGASSPIFDSKISEALDSRLEFYKSNQKSIPQIAGSIIPEIIEGYQDYENKILKPSYEAVAKYDNEGILAHDWLNSRGAIARFSRQSIEIRLLDISESPTADLTNITFITSLVQSLCESDLSNEDLKLSVQELKMQLDLAITKAEKAECLSFYNEFWKLKAQTLGELLSQLSLKFNIRIQMNPRCQKHWDFQMEHGPLARRILNFIKERKPNIKKMDLVSNELLVELCQKLSLCLEHNQSFKI